MSTVGDPRLSQAAALLVEVLTQQEPAPTSLEQIDTQSHRLAHAVGRQAAECYATSRIAAAEAARPVCACGTALQAERRTARAFLFLTGLVRLGLRRYHCPHCGAWRCPGLEALQAAPRQRMTRAVQEAIQDFGLSWSFAVAASRLGRYLPGVAVSAKTVERVTKARAAQVQTQEDAAAQRSLAAEAGEETPPSEGAPEVPLETFARPERVYGGLDGVLVRARQAKEWVEVQVGSLWSAWREFPDRKTPRRIITDRTLVARATGWEKLGEQVWRVFVHRGGLRRPEPEVVVLGDGAQGIRSLRELHFPDCLALLDPWHLWEKVKERAREVFRDRERALGAAQGVYARLKRGAVAEALEMIELWPAASEGARERRERLRAFLERNREQIRDYEQLRQQGYMTGSGLTEKANDLVVVPRMKNGKMHWSREGANAVALLRAYVLNDPGGSLLPT